MSIKLAEVRAFRLVRQGCSVQWKFGRDGERIVTISKTLGDVWTARGESFEAAMAKACAMAFAVVAK